jgi:transposase-like protein
MIIVKKCPHCGGERINKDGIVANKQRYYCRDCKKRFREGEDRRVKYTNDQKMLAIKLYTKNMGIRSIVRTLNTSSTLVMKWLKNVGKSIKDKIDKVKSNTSDNIDEENIKILECDEIETYLKKT